MNVERVIAQLEEEYPGKKIIKIPEENPTEIICEIDPTEDHPDHSTAIAVIDRTKSHRHRESLERYEVLKGTVALSVGSTTHLLKKGEVFEIKRGQVHCAGGDESWVRVTSKPGWTSEDHYLVSLKQKD